MPFGRFLHLALRQGQRLAPRRAHPHQFDPEAGIDILQLGREQPRHMRRIAGCSGEFKLAQHQLAIDPPQAEFEPARTLAPPFEHPHHVVGEVFDYLVEQAAMADRLHQPSLDQWRFNRKHRQQRLGHAAQQLVEPHQRIGGRRATGAEAPLERIASDLGNISDPLEAKPPQHQQHIGIEPQRSDGKVVQTIQEFVIARSTELASLCSQ